MKEVITVNPSLTWQAIHKKQGFSFMIFLMNTSMNCRVLARVSLQGPRLPNHQIFVRTVWLNSIFKDTTRFCGRSETKTAASACYSVCHAPPTEANSPEQLKPVNKPDVKKLLQLYKDLSKARLSGLVVVTTFAGYALAPVSLFATSPMLLGSTLIGTALCSFSANAYNQWIEMPFDSQMSRTKGRPLPQHSLSPPHAFTFATLSGIFGVTLLYFAASQISAALAFGTIVLYAGVYTPCKRWSIANTWIGSVVGALPPLIGWSAAMASLAPFGHTSTWLTLAHTFPSSSFILPAILFSWQFPHFNSLSWNLRKDYAQAGYCMSSVLQPALNARVSLRYALCLLPITWLAYYSDLVDSYFLLTGNVVNLPLIFYAFRFYKNSSKETARSLFFASLLHLPLLLFFLFLHKKKTVDDVAACSS